MVDECDEGERFSEAHVATMLEFRNRENGVGDDGGKRDCEEGNDWSVA